MTSGVIVEEQVFQSHYRVVLVKSVGKHLYSIDYYKRLSRKPKCSYLTMIEGSPAHLCYAKISEDCEAVIVVTVDRIEIVNLRLLADASRDPAEGDPGKARKLCLERAEKWLSEAEESAV